MQITTKIYVTYSRRLAGGKRRHCAIPCDTQEEARERAESLSRTPGLKYVGINQCGRLTPDVHILKPGTAK